MRKKYLSFKFHITFPLESFKEYAHYIEESLRKEVRVYEDMANDLDEEEKEAFWDHYIDEVSKYYQEFPQIMRNSLFVSIYTFLEDKLIELCVPNDETTLKLSDINGKGIQQASIYLKKVLRINFPDHSKEWHFIKNSNLIRNCIVHNNGDISKSSNEKKLRNIIKDMSNVTIDNKDYIILDNKFCDNFINNVESFLSQLYGFKK